MVGPDRRRLLARSISLPRSRSPLSQRSFAANSAAEDAPSEPAASWLPIAIAIAPLACAGRKNKPSAVFAAFCAVAVAGVAALFLMVKADPAPTVANRASAASSAAAAAVVEAPVVVVARRCGAAPAGTAQSGATRRCHRGPRSRQSRRRLRRKTRARRSEPVRSGTSRGRYPRATAVAQNGVDACKDKFFLLKEFCLAEQCEKPGSRNHALCAKHREEARLREESRVRN